MCDINRHTATDRTSTPQRVISLSVKGNTSLQSLTSYQSRPEPAQPDAQPTNGRRLIIFHFSQSCENVSESILAREAQMLSSNGGTSSCSGSSEFVFSPSNSPSLLSPHFNTCSMSWSEHTYLSSPLGVLDQARWPVIIAEVVEAIKEEMLEVLSLGALDCPRLPWFLRLLRSLRNLGCPSLPRFRLL